MTGKLKPLWHVLLLAIWINLAETVRWVLYSKSQFEAHLQGMGLGLPNTPLNGILWMVWGTTIAFVVYMVAQKFTLLQTTIITWLAGFVLVWIALWNCAVLPLGILPVVIPLSLVTMFIAVLIARKLQPRPSA